jgi:hypothetical protein
MRRRRTTASWSFARISVSSDPDITSGAVARPHVVHARMSVWVPRFAPFIAQVDSATAVLESTLSCEQKDGWWRGSVWLASCVDML